jgi:formate dehydrogenase
MISEGCISKFISAGRVGLAVLRRLRPFDVRLYYTDPKRLPLAVEDDLRLTRDKLLQRNARRHHLATL